jgi:hypothetical protein
MIQLWYILFPLVQSQFTVSPPFLSSLSQTCQSVIKQSLDCSDALSWAGQNERFESDTTLSSVCKGTCSAAIVTWERRVSGACKNDKYDLRDGGMMASPLFLVEQVKEKYQKLCVKDS